MRKDKLDLNILVGCVMEIILSAILAVIFFSTYFELAVTWKMVGICFLEFGSGYMALGYMLVLLDGMNCLKEACSKDIKAAGMVFIIYSVFSGLIMLVFISLMVLLTGMEEITTSGQVLLSMASLAEHFLIQAPNIRRMVKPGRKDVDSDKRKMV